MITRRTGSASHPLSAGLAPATGRSVVSATNTISGIACFTFSTNCFAPTSLTREHERVTFSPFHRSMKLSSCDCAVLVSAPLIVEHRVVPALDAERLQSRPRSMVDFISVRALWSASIGNLLPLASLRLQERHHHLHPAFRCDVRRDEEAGFRLVDLACVNSPVTSGVLCWFVKQSSASPACRTGFRRPRTPGRPRRATCRRRVLRLTGSGSTTCRPARPCARNPAVLVDVVHEDLERRLLLVATGSTNCYMQPKSIITTPSFTEVGVTPVPTDLSRFAGVVVPVTPAGFVAAVPAPPLLLLPHAAVMTATTSNTDASRARFRPRTRSLQDHAAPLPRHQHRLVACPRWRPGHSNKARFDRPQHSRGRRATWWSVWPR